jgi:iron complex outermembrane receptor protein
MRAIHAWHAARCHFSRFDYLVVDATMKFHEHRLTCAVAVAGALMAAQAGAQQEAAPAAANPSPAAARQSDQLQSVMVTATKRKEDASKVATSISVIGGDDLAAQHITTFADVTRAVPNISFSSGSGGAAGNGAGLSNISMRGVSSDAGAATVGIYLDDISMSIGNVYSMGSAEPKFFDLDHVEVLRGPQGTLYGASSMGGTIKFLSNQPDLKSREASFYSEFSSTEGGGNNYLANAVLNEPLIPGELALRIGVQTSRNGGYIDQVDRNTGAVLDTNTNTEHAGVLRFAMKWSPTKDLAITPSLFYQKVKTGDIDVSFTQLPGSGEPLPRNQAAKLLQEPGEDRLTVPSLTVNYATALGDITSVTSYFERTFNRRQDGSTIVANALASYIVDPALANTVANLPAAVYLDNTVHQVSQELRMASRPYDPAVSRWTWIAGVYAARQRTSIVDNEPILGLNAAFNAAGLSPTDPAVIIDPVSVGFPGDNTYYGLSDFDDRQYSVFGEANYYFSPTLHATVGVRYLRASSKLHQAGAYFFNNHLDGLDGFDDSTATVKGHKTTPKFALTWEVDGNNTLYASAAQGFRLGGVNSPVPTELCGLSKPTPLGYGADSLWSYEAGNKSRLLDNRLSINASAFYVKWKNLQQQVFVECGFAYNSNAGDATSYGAEVEIQAKPVRSVVLSLSGGVTHATLSDSAGEAAGLPGAVAGANIPGVPKFNASVSAQYNFNLASDVYGFVRAASRWTGKSNGGYSITPSMQPNPDYRRPAYSLVDASAGISWGNLDVTVFAENLANNRRIIQRPAVQGTDNQAYRITPRTIGVSLSGKL